MWKVKPVSIRRTFTHIITNESDLCSAVLETPDFSYMPYADPAATVKIKDFFITDESGTLAPFDNEWDHLKYVCERPIFINGNVVSWNERTPSIPIRGIEILGWYVLSSEAL